MNIAIHANHTCSKEKNIEHIVYVLQNRGASNQVARIIITLVPFLNKLEIIKILHQIYKLYLNLKNTLFL